MYQTSDAQLWSKELFRLHLFDLYDEDEELSKLLGGVTIAQGGVLPNIQAVLLPKKTEKVAKTKYMVRGDGQLKVEDVERSEQNTNQTSVQPDVWTELRELRDMVVEQRVKLQFSQSQIEELKNENTGLNNRLLVSESQVEKLKQDNAEVLNPHCRRSPSRKEKEKQRERQTKAELER
ncbi:hypothetical protein SRHO_G00213260 [Serrasalmus rhombeus]